eukprot:g3948.t1
MDSQPPRLSDVTLRLAFSPSPSRGPRRADDPVATVARLAMQTRTAIVGIPKKAEPAARMATDILGQVATAATRGLDAEQVSDAATVLEKLLNAVERTASDRLAAEADLRALAGAGELVGVSMPPNDGDGAIVTPLLPAPAPATPDAPPAAQLQLPPEFTQAITTALASKGDANAADAKAALSDGWDAPRLHVAQPKPWPAYLGVNGFAPDDVIRLQIPADHTDRRSDAEITYMDGLIAEGADRDALRMADPAMVHPLFWAATAAGMHTTVPPGVFAAVHHGHVGHAVRSAQAQRRQIRPRHRHFCP